MFNLNSSVLTGIGGLYSILVFASVFVYLLRKKKPDQDYTELIQRIRSWWIIITLFSFALITTRIVAVIFLAFVCFLALKEYLSLASTRRADRRVLFWAYLAIPVQFYWVYINWYGMFIIFIPVYMFLFLPMRMIIIGETKGFLKSVGTLHWGLMTTVFCLSHVCYLLALPSEINQDGGGAGLMLFLVVATQFNDVAQYVWGKNFGKRKIIPKVSPNKTWEGFLGGIATTTLLSFALGPFLTPLTHYQALLAGLIIGVGGFVGDVTVSAVKRDIGVKDFSALIPGHGGVMDRVDSLYYTAPLFFHYIYYLHY